MSTIATSFPKTIQWKGDDYEVPNMEALEFWAVDSVCETPDGEIVEPDNPDSWLALLGLV